jgi:hypothetical protein
MCKQRLNFICGEEASRAVKAVGYFRNGKTKDSEIEIPTTRAVQAQKLAVQAM